MASITETQQQQRTTPPPDETIAVLPPQPKRTKKMDAKRQETLMVEGKMVLGKDMPKDNMERRWNDRFGGTVGTKFACEMGYFSDTNTASALTPCRT